MFFIALSWIFDIGYAYAGTVGFFSCLYFNYQIYASIKVD
jgi:hypothetical protein